jgi:hypothetical protein
MIAIVIVVILIVAYGIPAIARAIFAPWSIGWLGRDTLTGRWVGSIYAQQGAEYGLHLKLVYREREPSLRSTSVGTGYSNLGGVATLCTPTGDRYAYEIAGGASPFGTVEDLWLEYDDPELSRLNLWLTGKWDAPELRLRADKNPFQPDGRFERFAPVSSADAADSLEPFTLLKGDSASFDAICERIRR